MTIAEFLLARIAEDEDAARRASIYAYQDEHGGCGALHQRALTALRRIIPAHIPLSWTDEFTGETHALRPR